MKNIVYQNPSDLQKFELKKFVKSLSKYAKVTEKEAEQALEKFAHYDTLHVSCLVEAGTNLIGQKAGEDAMAAYYNDHSTYLGEGKFERLRRITGYLVGSLDRWNDAKKPKKLPASNILSTPPLTTPSASSCSKPKPWNKISPTPANFYSSPQFFPLVTSTANFIPSSGATASISRFNTFAVSSASFSSHSTIKESCTCSTISAPFGKD